MVALEVSQFSIPTTVVRALQSFRKLLKISVRPVFMLVVSRVVRAVMPWNSSVLSTGV
jgi:hypothetical protein